MRKRLTFNGQKKDWLYLLEGRQKSPFAPIRNNLIKIPGMAGAYVDRKEIDVLYITQPIGFIANDDNDALIKQDELAAWLVHDEPKALEFGDEPGRIYFAEIEGTIEEFVKVANKQYSGVITFLVADGHGYSTTEQHLTFPADTVILHNDGTAETEPIYTFNVLQDTTFALVSNGEEYMMIGRPANADELPKNTKPLILNDPASTLVGWSNFTGGFNFYGMGLVGGSMKVQGGYAFTPNTWGSNPNGWTGPAIRKSLSEPLQDFEIEIDIAMLNKAAGVGTIRVVGLDASDKPVFSMGMVDSTNGYQNNRAVYGLGENNKQWFTYQGDGGQKVWNNGRFVLKITRKGKEFTAHIGRKLDPEGRQMTGRHTRKFTDTRNEHQNPITQIAIYIARARNFVNFGMLFHHLAVWKLIDLGDYRVPIIAVAGDEIEFNFKEAECYVNGFPVPFDFGADFFPLKKGENPITVLPEDTFETSVKYREKFL